MFLYLCRQSAEASPSNVVLFNFILDYTETRKTEENMDGVRVQKQ